MPCWHWRLTEARRERQCSSHGQEITSEQLIAVEVHLQGGGGSTYYHNNELMICDVEMPGLIDCSLIVESSVMYLK